MKFMKSKPFTMAILAALLIALPVAALFSGCGVSGNTSSTTTAGTTTVAGTTAADAGTTTTAAAENTTAAASTTAESTTAESTTAATTTAATTTAATTTAATTTAATTTAESTTEAAAEGGKKLTPWGYDASDIYLIKQGGDATEYWKRFSETDVGAVILDKFGIDFEIVPNTGGTATEREMVLLAAGDYYEIAFMVTGDVRNAYLSANALVPMDDYLDKMPEFRRVYEDQIPYWRAAVPDKKVYFWQGNGVPYKLKSTIVSYSGIMTRADIMELYADNYGWDKPPIYSDEWLDVFKLASEAGLKDVDGNNMIGVTSCFGESYGLAGTANSFIENTVDYVGTSSRTIIYNFTNDAFVGIMDIPHLKEQYKFFNSLWNMGMLDEESFTDLYSRTAEKEHKASPAGVWYISWEEEGANAYIREAGHPEMQYVKMPVISATEKGKRLNAYTMITNDYVNIGVSKNAKNPGRIFELLEYLRSDEGAIMSQNGIEGVHWEYVNGVRTEIQSFFDRAKDDPALSNRTGILYCDELGIPTLYTLAADGYPISISRSDEYIARHTNPDYLPNKIRSKFGWTTPFTWIYDNTDIKVNTMPMSISFETGSDFDILNGRMLEVRLHNIYDVWTAKESDFETAFNKMLDEYHALDVQSVYDEYGRLSREIAAAVNPG